MADTPLTDDPRPDGLARANSLLLVNTGDGKGKSSAAFGVMLRSVAMGWQVVVLQFVKSGQWKVGEEKIGRQLGVEWHSLGEGFTWDSTNLEHDKAHAQLAWKTAAEVIGAGKHRLVTGRDCPAEIIGIADTVTEMRKVKHAYDQGITAKKGIEY